MTAGYQWEVRLAALVPAYNESRTIGEIVERCLKYTSLVVVVDDGSTDDTALAAERSGARVLKNVRNRGLGASLRRGFSYLLENKVQYVVTVDGDGVHKPEYIPDLVRWHIDTGADLTIGSRFMKSDSSVNLPSPKVAANRFATNLINHSLGCSLTDVASGMRVFGQRMLGSHFISKKFSIAYDTISVALRSGLRIEEFPIQVHYAPDILACTKRLELLDLLKFTASLPASDDQLRVGLNQMIRDVECLRKIYVNLGSHRFVLHPLREYDSFVFQDDRLSYNSYTGFGYGQS